MEEDYIIIYIEGKAYYLYPETDILTPREW